MVVPHYRADSQALLTRPPLYSFRRTFALDLHVLGLPPAFNLSHDQTLQFKNSDLFSHPKTARWNQIFLNTKQLQLLYELRVTCVKWFLQTTQAPTRFAWSVLLKSDKSVKLLTLCLNRPRRVGVAHSTLFNLVCKRFFHLFFSDFQDLI